MDRGAWKVHGVAKTRLIDFTFTFHISLHINDLHLMEGAMLSKSLIQFSVDGWGCVPSLLFDLRPNSYGGNEDNGNLLHRKLDQRFTEHGPTHQNKTQFPPQTFPSGSFHKSLIHIHQRADKMKTTVTEN